MIGRFVRGVGSGMVKVGSRSANKAAKGASGFVVKKVKEKTKPKKQPKQ